MANQMSSAISASSMDLPPAVPVQARRVVGEASSESEMNREPEFRYTSGYTSSVPEGMPAETQTQESVGATYDAHYDLLRFIATQRFHVPAADVRPIIHDVFVAYLRHRANIGDSRLWLTEAVRNACRNYWRDRKTAEPLPLDVMDARQFVDDVAARVDVARLLSGVPVACRMLLRLRFVEGLDAAEIAARCSIEPGNARIRVHRCLKAARAALARDPRS